MTKPLITILDDEGYKQIILGDLEQDDTGLPHWVAIRPTDGQLFFDREPTAAENGRIYKYRYDKDLELTLLTDVFPFSDIVFRAIVRAASQLYKLDRHQEFSSAIFDISMARAAHYLRQLPPRDTWGKQVLPPNATDPFNDVTVT